MVSALGFLPPIPGIAGLVVAYMLYNTVTKYPEGEESIRKIGDKIHEGAMVFMRREHSILVIFLAVQVVLTFVFLTSHVGIAVITGAISSSIAGWIGMYSATKANVRTATAAQQEGAASALTVAFFGGSIMGLSVAALGLIGLGGLYVFLTGVADGAASLEGFGMGASTVALFSRVGGGIFTKAADVGPGPSGAWRPGRPILSFPVR